MSNQLFMEERRRTILEQLHHLGRVSVNELSVLLNVSAVTIRQDLRALEEENLLERTHGGAVLPAPKATAPELSFEIRQLEKNRIKEALAAEAAKLVKSGDSIALDASTTVYAMLPHLRKLERLLIVTNSLMVAQYMLDVPHIEVIMPGGTFRRESISLVGHPEHLPDINLNSGFFGAQGVTAETGITESSKEEMTINRSLMQQCISPYFLIDERKWGIIAPYTTSDLRSVAGIFTPITAPRRLVEDAQKIGANIIQVPVYES